MTRVASAVCECGHFTHSDTQPTKCMIVGCDCKHYKPKYQEGTSVMTRKKSGGTWQEDRDKDKDEKKYSSWGKYSEVETFLKEKKNYVVSMKNAITGEEDKIAGCFLDDMQARLAALTRKEYLNTDGWYVESVKE